MGSCPEFILISLACNLLGAQWIPVNTDYRGEWLKQTLDDSEARFVFTDLEHLPQIEALGNEHESQLIVKQPHQNYGDLQGAYSGDSDHPFRLIPITRSS